MLRKIAQIKNDFDLIGIDIIFVPDWDGFEKIAKYLQLYFDAKIKKRTDGPYSRRWIIEIESNDFFLDHDDIEGNTFSPLTKEGEIIVRQVEKNLLSRLSAVPRVS